MDQATRNSLQNATQQARRLLEREITEQLEGIFDVLPNGTIADKPGKHLDASQRLVRTKIVESIRHRAGGSAKADMLADAVADYVREAAFTILNRYIALKMLEVRGLVQQCITKGDQSSGFKEFGLAAPGLAQLPDKGYRLYLESLFDELSTEVRILFDRHSDASFLWPRRQAFDGLLEILNAAELAAIWNEDETLGWLYQYYNSRQEIDALRKTSEAPRDSREMAVRNQFFTPRYVVEFLTDNTLGRTWYEMRQGVTTLAESCRYLMRRPDEVFLGAMTESKSDLATEACAALANAMTDEAKDALPEFSADRPQAMIALAHCVDGYVRHPPGQEIDGQWWPWHAKARMEAAADLAEFKTQDLLDVMFARCRADRHGDGDGIREPIFTRIANEVRRRVLDSREPDRTQEQLLKQPVFVPFRAKKDPRDLKILDPACGSSHFLIYCFDLLLDIYDEAWDDDQSPASALTGNTLKADYPTLGALHDAVPGLILRHNLHGIDIDARCAQIGAFALWMRAQRAYADFKIAREKRQEIKKANIVVAEPMPGDESLLKEFKRSLQPALLGQLIQVVFDKMQLASDAGSLLRIEEELKDAISVARAQWLQGAKEEQSMLFAASSKPVEQLQFDMSGIDDEQFWHEAETRTIAALRAFSASETNAIGFRRRLFAEDATAGFAYIDVCRLRFDVVLMNPPFGDASLPSKPYIEDTYGDTKGDVFKAFVECFQDRLVPAGHLGIISSRTGFFLSTARDWRERILLRLYRLSVVADLGYGVLDAKVETAAYVLRSLSASEDDTLTSELIPALAAVPVDANGYFSIPKYQKQHGGLKRHQALGEIERLLRCGAIRAVAGSFARFSKIPKAAIAGRTIASLTTPPDPVGIFIRLLKEADKKGALDEIIPQMTARTCDARCFVSKLSSFRSIPGTPFAYWVSRNIRRLYGDVPTFALEGVRTVKQGLATADDFRFVRLWWEVPPESRLDPLAAPHWTVDIGTFQQWCRDRTRVGRGWVAFAKGGQYTPFHADTPMVLNWAQSGEELAAFEASVIRNPDYYFRPGLTYLSRTSLRLCSTPLPAGSIFSHVGPAILPESGTLLFSLSRFNSYAVEACISPFHARGTEGDDQTKKYEVGLLQSVPWPLMQSPSTPSMNAVLRSFQDRTARDETARSFTYDKWGDDPTEELLSSVLELEQVVATDYGLALEEAFSAATGENGANTELAADLRNGIRVGLDWPSAKDQMIGRLQYAVGCLFGRWDVRLATGERAMPAMADPFDPLPVCPPAMLVDGDGMPAKELPSGYPIPVRADGIAVDDPGHPADVVQSMESVIATIMQSNADSWLASAASALDCHGNNSTDLRPWMRREFFGEHCKRYKRTPRKAPIYWQLSVPSVEYSVWLYYPKLSADTLFRVLNDYIRPKLRDQALVLARARREIGEAPTRSQRDALGQHEVLADELQVLHDHLEVLAPLWHPNLNDGVLINFAPLWRLVPQHKGWQKDCKACWDALAAGEYDWSHLAMHLWPERVVPKCVTDRSLAIAHGLVDVFWEQDDKDKWVKRKPPEDAGKAGWQPTIDRLVAERTGRHVKDALANLFAAPTAEGGGKRGRRSQAAAESAANGEAARTGTKRKGKTAKVRDESEELF